MHVVATAGHVDHGKSTLVRALTGMEPDRWAEERRRGMTIDLGFAWTRLPAGGTVAFVDVPGHERFVPNMLAGVGPVPAAMIVVAADEGWMPQSAEHLAALDALGVRHGLLAVTRSDLADPEPPMKEALDRIAGTALGTVEAVAVSGATGAGLADLRAALDRLLARVPAPDGEAPVRLWVDRVFTIRGSGTVVTGTLGAGRLRTGDELELGGRPVRVRGLQSLGEPVAEIGAVARVAVNLRGVDRERVARGDALLTPGRFRYADVIDVRLHGEAVADLPPEVTLHAGAAAVTARVRPLGADTARLRLDRALPLRLGDRALLRDPGREGPRVAGGVTVLDVQPPPLTRRGAARARAAELSTMEGRPDGAAEVRRRGLVRQSDLERMGVSPVAAPVAGEWLADPEYWAALRARLAEAVARYAERHPLEQGAPVEALRQALGLPDRALVAALVAPPLVARAGRVGRAALADALPPALARALDVLRTDLAAAPFQAPDANRLAALGLGSREIGAAVRAGALFRVAEGVVLLPGAVEAAVRILGALPQPFTTSQARQALDTSRRVALPLLDLLDRRGATRRHADDRREVTGG
ncbi:selenocysteine-specific translation elongation factor [Rhizomonospora bruguierae]|uniref:selenocysteine-specific translation elongation factor n=1 Tax=Rhizomonospora bruguierae TaxID=1581705 RepID=UPI001BCEE04D|nr:selenocysteine-specific translation elongation factor [Micromonospora sp. NBRC 107566]